MKYGITSEHGQLLIECINGGIGSRGQRLIARDAESVVRLADRLAKRGHITFDITYKDRRVSEQAFKAIQESEEFIASEVRIAAESRWDVLSLVGFARVMLERPQVVSHKRAA